MYVLEFRSVGVSMFQSTMDKKMIDQLSKEAAEEISLFDVKELYDAAYELKDKANENSAHQFKEALANAVKLDMAYRRQLAKQVGFNQYRTKDFSPALDTHRKGNAQVA